MQKAKRRGGVIMKDTLEWADDDLDGSGDDDDDDFDASSGDEDEW